MACARARRPEGRGAAILSSVWASLVEALQGFGVAVEGHQHLGFGGEEAPQAVAFQKREVQALEAVEVAVAAFKVY